jgi:CheY-like chemotaxis protein
MEPQQTILLLEHDEADVFFFRRALMRAGFAGQVRVVGSVGEARDYLDGREMFADRRYYPMPDLIVSDFKVPGRTGQEFLEWLQAHPVYRNIAFVMFSGAATDDEAKVALRHGARAFVRKELDFNDAVGAVRMVLTHLPPAESREQ